MELTPAHRVGTYAWAQGVVYALDLAMTTRTGTTRKTPTRHLRDTIVAIAGEAVPFGDGDVKTGAPGMYRTVGSTCPLDCAHHPANDNTCYASSGNVGIHQRRAVPSILAAAVTAAACMVWAQRTDRVARLHVSGDIGKYNADPMAGAWLDYEYVALLATLALAVREKYDADVVAWSYTAFTGPGADMCVSDLANAGIVMRRSGHAGENGAITAPFAAVKALRKEFDVTLAKCPAQLRDVSCAECKLCWARPDVCIVFDPHGTGASKAKRLFDERH